MIILVKEEKDIKDTVLPFFGKEIYLKTKSSSYGWFVSNDFILPFTLFKHYIFKRIVFTSSVIPRNKNSSTQSEKYFLNDILEYIKKNKLCDFIHKPQPNAVFNNYPDNCDVYKWGTYKLEINTDLDGMINKMSKSQVRYTKKALKDGVIIEKSEDKDEIFEFCNNTLIRQKIPLLMNKTEFENQFKLLYPNNMMMFKSIYKEEIQGTLIIFFDKESAYYEFGGSANNPYKGSLKLMHLYAMQYLRDNHGIKNYDFIGAIIDVKENTKEAGIQKFKKEFGSQLIEGYQFSVVINPIKYFIFNLCLKTLFKIKGIKYEDPVKRCKNLSTSNLKI